METCPICRHAIPPADFSTGKGKYSVNCDYCGRFRISADAAKIVEESSFDRERHLLGGVLRNAFKIGEQFDVMPDTIEDLVARAPRRLSVSRILDEMLLGIYRSTVEGPSLASTVTVDPKIYPLYYLKSEMDIRRLVRLLVDSGLVETLGTGADGTLLQLAEAGWDRAEQLELVQGRPDQAFIAMSFDKSLDAAFAGGIKPALERTGYTVIRIDHVEHTDKIDDRILAEIRRSGLLVVDFSLHRPSVYFEAGFAHGLGVPIIWTCRKDQLGGSQFDTRQYNQIAWTTPEELGTRLENRIRALGFAREPASNRHAGPTNPGGIRARQL